MKRISEFLDSYRIRATDNPHEKFKANYPLPPRLPKRIPPPFPPFASLNIQGHSGIVINDDCIEFVISYSDVSIKNLVIGGNTKPIIQVACLGPSEDDLRYYAPVNRTKNWKCDHDFNSTYVGLLLEQYFTDRPQPRQIGADAYEFSYAKKIKKAILENQGVEELGMSFQLPMKRNGVFSTEAEYITFNLKRPYGLQGYDVFLDNQLVGFLCLNKFELFWDDTVNKFLETKLFS